MTLIFVIVFTAAIVISASLILVLIYNFRSDKRRDRTLLKNKKPATNVNVRDESWGSVGKNVDAKNKWTLPRDRIGAGYSSV